jgi:signal transduction histidine kinase
MPEVARVALGADVQVTAATICARVLAPWMTIEPPDSTAATSGEARWGWLWRRVDAHIPPATRADPERWRRARILVITCGLYLTAGAVGLLPRLALPGLTLAELLGFVALLTPAAITPRALRRGGSMEFWGALVVLSGVAAAIFGALVMEGLFSASVVWVALVPPVASFLLGPRFLRPAAVLALLLIAALAVAHGVGLLEAVARPKVIHRAINLAAMCLFTAMLARVFESAAVRARQAQAEAASLLRELTARLEAGALLLDGDRVVYATPAAEALLGDGAAVGASFRALTGIDAPISGAELGALEFDRGAARLQARFGEARAEGQPLTLVTLVDLTDRVRAENERLALQARLQDAERLDSMGRIAGGVAHDFNNLLVSILTNAEMVSSSPRLSDEERQMVGDIALGADRAAGLVRQLLAYAGRGRAVLGAVDLVALAAETVRLAGAGRPGGSAVGLEQPARLPKVWADPTLIAQVVTNLVTNALDAAAQADRAGQVRVSLHEVELDAAGLAACQVAAASASPGRFVEVCVRDAGVGFRAAELPRLFEPFYSRKAHGNGLGLAAVQGIVRRLGAALRVDGTPGEGASFCAYFPVAQEADQAAEIAAARDDTAAETAGLRVLVVDDDPLVRLQIARVLRRGGCDVVECDDGAAAVEEVRAAPGQFDCAVVDFLMPGLDGAETARQMGGVDGALPVVLCSGTVDAADLAGSRFAAVVSKPFRPQALLDTVRRHRRVEALSGG